MTFSPSKGAIYIRMSPSELDRLQKAFRKADGHWSTFIIWAKNVFTTGRSDYQRQYEPIQ
jgi:DNA modification methylase